MREMNKYVRLRGLTYIALRVDVGSAYMGMPIIRPDVARFYERRIPTLRSNEWAWPARCPICPILGWGAKFTKLGDSLPWTPMNRRAKLTPQL